MVPDNSGTLKLGYPGDEVCMYVCVRVCGVRGQLSKLRGMHAWLIPISSVLCFILFLFPSGKEFCGHSAMSWVYCGLGTP